MSAASDVWSGGKLVLVSNSFTGVDSTPLVLLGADTLAPRSFGGYAVQVQLPDTDGPITLRVRLRGGGQAIVPVRVHGLVGVREGPPLDLYSQVTQWPGNGNATALAVQRGQLVMFDLRRFSVSGPLAPDTTLGCRNAAYLIFKPPPIPSATVANLVTVVSCSGDYNLPLLLAIPLTGGLSPDTGPPTSAEVAVHLRRGVWLISLKPTGLQVFTRQPSGGFTWTPETYWEASGAVVSPRGDRLVPTFTYCGGLIGPPVYDLATVDVAYRIPEFQCTSGPAAFSPAGDTLFAEGVHAPGSLTSPLPWQEELVALDAATGALLARTKLWDTSNYLNTYATALAVDPLGPYLYVFGTDGPELLVFDRATLAIVATLRPSARIAASLDPQRLPLPGYPGSIVMDPLFRRLYAIPQAFGSPRPYVFEYDLMP